MVGRGSAWIASPSDGRQDAAHDQRPEQPPNRRAVPHHVHHHDEQADRDQVLEEAAHGRAARRSRTRCRRPAPRRPSPGTPPAASRPASAPGGAPAGRGAAASRARSPPAARRRRSARRRPGAGSPRTAAARRPRSARAGRLDAPGDRPGGDQPDGHRQRRHRRPERHGRANAPAGQQRQRHHDRRRAPGDGRTCRADAIGQIIVEHSTGRPRGASRQPGPARRCARRRPRRPRRGGRAGRVVGEAEQRVGQRVGVVRRDQQDRLAIADGHRAGPAPSQNRGRPGQRRRRAGSVLTIGRPWASAAISVPRRAEAPSRNGRAMASQASSVAESSGGVQVARPDDRVGQAAPARWRRGRPGPGSDRSGWRRRSRRRSAPA